MSKIEINVVAGCMKKHAIDPATMRAILEDLNLEAQPEPGEEKAPPVKKQFVVVVSDPEGRMPTCDLVAWVLQIPESESPATTEERIFRAAYDFNTTKRGRLLPVQTVGEAIESVPARFFKESEVWVKTKSPVLVLRTRNEIPKTDSILSDKDRGIDPARVAAVRSFKKLANESGAQIQIRTGEHTVTIDPDPPESERVVRFAPG